MLLLRRVLLLFLNRDLEMVTTMTMKRRRLKKVMVIRKVWIFLLHRLQLFLVVLFGKASRGFLLVVHIFLRIAKWNEDVTPAVVWPKFLIVPFSCRIAKFEGFNVFTFTKFYEKIDTDGTRAA